MAARWAEPPLRLRSIPQPTRSIGALAPDEVVDEAGDARRRSARTPRRPGRCVHSAQAARYSSTPSACSSTNARSTAPRRSSSAAAAMARTTSVPGPDRQEAGGPVGRRRPPGVDDHDLGPRPAPGPRAAGRRWELDTVGLPPQTTMRSLSTTSAGSALAIVPKTRRQALRAVAAQIVCSTSAAPSASNSSGVSPSLSMTEADEL